jgi:hypothetical protein
MSILATRPAVRKPRRKPVRTVRLSPPSGDAPGILDIVQDGKLTSFFYWPIPSDWGISARLEKFATHRRGDGDDEYDVNLEETGGSCECRGHLSHGHCRHVEALRALAAKGELPLSPVANAPAKRPPSGLQCPDCKEQWAKCGCHGQPEDDAA